jgi:hypothetical protein
MVDKTKNSDGASKIERAVNRAKQALTLGVNNSDIPYCVINKVESENTLAFPVRGTHTQKWLRQEAHARGDLLRREDIADIVETLCALASVSRNLMQIHHRTAPLACGGVAIDLCRPDKSVVHIKDGVMTLVSKGSKTLFTQSATMLSLPRPAQSGNIKRLLKYLNMSIEHKWLFIAWLTFTLSHPKGIAPYPFLDIKGEMGSGKSFLCKLVIRSLIDPNTLGVQTFPKDERELAISSQNQLLLIFDNMRELSKKMSDFLCVASTGGTYARRTLYSDTEETVLSFHSPMVLNGIHNFVLEGDLASRFLTINMLRIDNKGRLDESQILKNFAKDLPNIFRGLLDLCAQLLAVEKTTVVTRSERMIAFSRWLAAMEVIFKRPQGELQAMYSQNLKASNFNTLQENQLAMSMLNFASNLPQGSWQGTPTALLEALEIIAPDNIINRRSEWPSNPISMSKRLRILEKSLEYQGVTMDFTQSKTRLITISFIQPQTN